MGGFVAAVCHCGDSASAAKRDKYHTVEFAGRRRDLIPDNKMGMHLTHQHRLVAHTSSFLLSDSLLPKVCSTAPWSVCTYVPSISASGPSCLIRVRQEKEATDDAMQPRLRPHKLVHERFSLHYERRPADARACRGPGS